MFQSCKPKETSKGHAQDYCQKMFEEPWTGGGHRPACVQEQTMEISLQVAGSRCEKRQGRGTGQPSDLKYRL
jgi:hypothetical protein